MTNSILVAARSRRVYPAHRAGSMLLATIVFIERTAATLSYTVEVSQYRGALSDGNYRIKAGPRTITAYWSALSIGRGRDKLFPPH